MSMKDWEKDKKWSDRFLPEIKRILGEALISEAPISEDAEHNTDLMVLTLGAVRVGCRVRRYDAWVNPQYRREFTIREGRPSGAKTELTKIIEGWGDYFFYGFSGETEESLVCWTLADLKVFRLWFNRELAGKQGVLPGKSLPNRDGTTFRVFSFCDLPKEFVVNHWEQA